MLIVTNHVLFFSGVKDVANPGAILSRFGRDLLGGILLSLLRLVPWMASRNPPFFLLLSALIDLSCQAEGFC